MRKIRIGRRIIFTVLLVSGISSIAAVIALIHISTVNGKYNTLAEKGLIQGNISKFSASLNEEGELVRYMIDTVDQNEMTKTKEAYEISKEKTQNALEIMKKDAYNQESIELLEQMESSLKQFRLLCGDALELVQQNAGDQALEVYIDQARPQIYDAKAAADMLMDFYIATGYQVSSGLSAQTTLSMISVCSILVIGIIAAILLAIYNARLITGPLIELERAAASMAVGDYEVAICYESQDEFGSLADKMRTVIQNHK